MVGSILSWRYGYIQSRILTGMGHGKESLRDLDARQISLRIYEIGLLASQKGDLKEVIKAIVEIDIPVMGHVGLTPQSIHQMGGYKVQGRIEEQRRKIVDDALAVEEAGAFSLVLECIPVELAQEITERLEIPTIGIGAGVHCDGQVLVIHDLLGLLGEFRPKFVKRYVDLRTVISQAVGDYIKEIREKTFPTDEHSFHI